MELLRKLIDARARSLGIGLDDVERERVLRDITRWTARKREGDRLVKTEDGSYTLWSGEFGEPYHSITAGAVREALEKFVLPSRIVEKAALRGRVRILDVGFGLGYNVAVALYKIREAAPKAQVEVISLEKDLSRDIPILPEPYGRFHELIIELLPEGEREGVSVRVLLGDARKRVRSLIGFDADAVFHDPFSPYKNPEMWSLEFLEMIERSMDPEGYWVSYTSSLPVRRALMDLGFRVGSSKPVGRKRGGTVATLTGQLNTLGPSEKKRLVTSPFSVPFRDPGLERDPLEILVDYRLSVLLRERELSSGRKEGARTESPSGGLLSGSM